MEESFWHQRWANNQIAFHQSEANPLLVKHLPKLVLKEGARVFVPLCGKTLDIHWLLAEGYQVAGAELSRSAIEQLFGDLGVPPRVSAAGELQRYSADRIDIFVGNLFDLSAERLGPVDAIYDRAALVALPEGMRSQYTMHLKAITGSAPQLLISYVYDQNLVAGPPFSVSNEEITRHYQDSYQMTFLGSTDVAGGMKGKCPAVENVWLLKKG